MIIYRPGAVTAQQIRDIAGNVEVFSSTQPLVDTPQSALPSPGVGLRHYAPNARLVLIEVPSLESIKARIAQATDRLPGERVGIMLPAEVLCTISGAIPYPWGRWSVPEELAHRLYDGLRSLDAQGSTVILCPVPPGPGICEAIRDRLRKAASR
jgi:L-threonylcarbamoyladenylate synthase